MKCVEVIAKGKIESIGERKKAIVFGKWRVMLVPDSHWIESKKKRAQGKKKEECWILTGFEVVDDAEYAIMESADAMGSSGRQPHPTHTMPTVSPHVVGAADETNVSIFPSQVNRWELEKPEYGTTAYGFSLNF